MKKTITFVKLMGRWFADLPELKDQIDIVDCEMVAGADTMCAVLSKGRRTVTLTLSIEEPQHWDTYLTKIDDKCDYGANYDCTIFKKGENDESIIYKGQLWLCPVTEMVFGKYPKCIYIYGQGIKAVA